MDLDKVKALNKEQLLQCIKQSAFADVADILSMEDVDGESLMTMPEIHIFHWKMPMGERKKVLKFINEVKKNPSILSSKCLAISENLLRDDSSKIKTEHGPERPNLPRANSTITKPAITTPQHPKLPRSNKNITKPSVPLPEEARRLAIKENNLSKNKFESTVSYIQDCPRSFPNANVLAYDNEQSKDNSEEPPKTKMNNLEKNMLESDESYIEMGSNSSKNEDYLIQNRSILTIENLLEDPNYEAPPERPTAPSPIKVGFVSAKKIKLKLGARELSELSNDTHQSYNDTLNNHISVNVGKQCNKRSGSFSFLHGALMKNLLNKHLKGNKPTTEGDIEKQKDVKSPLRPLPETPNTKPEDLQGLKKSSEKECKPPLMPKARKPLPRLSLHGDHEAIYENAVDEEAYGNVVTTEDLAVLRRKYQKDVNPKSAEKGAKVDKLAMKLAEQLKNRISKDTTDLDHGNSATKDDTYQNDILENSTSQDEDVYQNNIIDTTDMEDKMGTKFLNRPLPNTPKNGDDDDEDEIYDCFKKNDPFSLFNINKEPYFRNTDRKGAKTLLAKLEDGAFLFRPSKSHFLVLTIKYRDGNRHFGIKRIKNKLRLDAVSGSEVPDFASLKEFVEYFTKNAISFESNEEMFEIYLKPVLSSDIF